MHFCFYMLLKENFLKFYANLLLLILNVLKNHEFLKNYFYQNLLIYSTTKIFFHQIYYKNIWNINLILLVFLLFFQINLYLDYLLYN